MDFEDFIEKYKMDYEIVTLKHQGKTYKEIADHFNLSKSRIQTRYKRFQRQLFDLYVNYLHSMQIKIDKWDIYDFYESHTLAIAYLEKTYEDNLYLLRHGTPPIIFDNHMNIPSLRKLTEEKILELEKYILKAREEEKQTFSYIGKELELSREKTKYIYDLYYHKKVVKAYSLVKSNIDCSFKDFLYNYSNSPKKKWELLQKNFKEILEDTI